MKIKISTILYICLCFLQTFNIVASNNSNATDSLIFKAMEDEMNRNLSDLTYQDNPKPFFISYTISDAQTLLISASNGALINSRKNHNRSWSARVIVGDYKLNDENYRGHDVANNGNNFSDVQIPLEDDYFGIRRALWIATNNIYKSATTKYKSKKNLLDEKEIADSLLIDDFSKAPKMELIQSKEKFVLNQNYYEKLSRELSGIFKDHPDIYASSVSVGILNSDIYFINSEGTKTKTPQNIFELSVSAVSMNKKGEYIPVNISYHALETEDIPSKEFILDDIKLLINHLSDLGKAPVFNDSYNGPVLVEGNVATDFFINELFSGQNSLIASRENLFSNANMGVYYGESQNDMEKNIGKRVAGIDLSVYAKAKLEEYNGTKLFGSFKIDGEGVIPPEEIVLIENSTLKNLLNGRTPTRAIPNSNGHNRFSTRFGYFYKSVTPGVIEINSAQTESYDHLKKDLLKKAYEYGYNYAFIIKPIKNGNNIYPQAFFKVDVETGEELLVRSASIGNSPYDFLRNISGFSDNTAIYNLISSQNGGVRNSYRAMMGTNLIDGVPVSFIMPDAMLLKNMKIEGVNTPITNVEPVVSQPVLE